MDSRNKMQYDASTHKSAYHDPRPQRQPKQSQKKNVCQYYGKTRHIEKKIFKKRDNLEEKVKRLEGDMLIVCRPTNNFTFQVRTIIAQVVGCENTDPTTKKVIELGNTTPNVTSM
jgi:hypothetical protein